ncbi:MAG: transglutaminase domain-containing protein [Moraxellaceae bacterium]|nr:transglutaminase domain-containing protein [Moraxellaceae bacterium]
MRAAGIPARVVVGYQGGEWSPNKDSWQVRQMDAHAWVEAWLPNKG